MKYLFILFAALLFACSNNNDLTIRLLKDKKITEDSINLAHNYESYYMQQAKEQIHSGKDSLIWSASADSSGYFFRRGIALKEKLKAIEFSLDSLSRMK